ncbi:MAG: flagellar hook-basal body complex protein [Fretibacterium sp.]|nr:flagellar hook-basal body complex protein [Fretibacterium sp.]
MLRSLMTAVTGVRAHQTMLDVTGNNIANANTTGFKKDNTVFQDLMYQNQKLASAPADGRGGINPAQVGLGVSVGAIETIFTQGAANYTGNVSDMMINGSGFFIYDNGTGSQLYSRSGATVRDADNNLVQSGTGYKLQGYQMEKDPINPSEYVRGSSLSDVNIPLGKKLEPNATTEVKFQCNLDSRSEAYLPYGFADLPYNSHCGYTGNPAGTAVISMDGKDYHMAFSTNFSDDGEDYLQIKIGLSAQDIEDGNCTTLALDMTGVSKANGVAMLAIDDEATAAKVLPGTSTTITSEYDDSTGTFKIRNGATGESLFEYNVHSNMNYASFSLNTKGSVSGAIQDISYDMIAEFDETAKEEGSNLSGRVSEITIWYKNPNPSSTTETDDLMRKITADVHFKVDGTFDYVDNYVGLPDGIVAYDYSKSDTENNAAGANFKIGVGNGGSSLLIQQGVMREDSTATTGLVTSAWVTTRNIDQGGYHQTKQTIYDCNGNEYTLEVNFKKVTENRWRWEAFLLDSEGNTVSTDPTCDDGTTSTSTANTVLAPQPSSGEIEFCGCGPICNVINAGDGTTSLNAEITIPFSLMGMPNQTIKLNMGGDGDKMYGVTQFASETTTKAVYQNGYAMGILEDYSVGSDGTITGNYTNGQRIPLYRVALATFANQQGLEKVGESMFRATINSGNANIDAAGVNGKGSILSQNLEMSNVDLTEEFTHLIIAQRGFQANTRVITTSDQILEEVVNLKR